MTKRKLDTINYGMQITSSKRSKLSNTNNYNNFQISNVQNDELYSSNNIQFLLSWSYIKDRVIDVDILNYNDKQIKEELWAKQQKKLIKKLKYDIYKFESSQLIEKFYIIAQKDNNNIITSSSIIRFFIQNDELIVDVIPVILHKYSRSIYSDLSVQSILNDIAINILCLRRSGVLIKSEGISISHFIEVMKLRINNVNNSTNIDQIIKNILEESSDSYKIIHQEIIDKYKIEFQANERKGNYSSEEDEILDVIDQIKDTIEKEEIICEVMEQLITRAVKKSERVEKNLSWDIAVVDNEGRTCNNKKVKSNDGEAIEIFSEAVKKWDLELFKRAKEKSRDFIKLVDYFNEEIKHEFWGHFYRNSYYKACLSGKCSFNKERKIIEKKYYNLLQDLEGYIFLIKNIPDLLDQLRAKQCSIIRDLPEDRQKDRSKDVIELIESKMSTVDSNGDANDQVITDVLTEMTNLVVDNLQETKKSNKMYNNFR